MSNQTRRDFLADVGKGMFLSALGAGLASDLGLGTAWALDEPGSLKFGDPIKLTQTVRVGARVWTTAARGQFRGVNYLATGVTTDRVPEDDIVVPTVHFEKADGELASVSLDENTKVERA